jgi:hypothetical protein
MPAVAAARTPFNFIAYCGTLFSHLDKKDVHLMG